MKHPRLSEKAKDRIVNGVLVCSITFLLVGFLYQPEAESATTPSESPRSTGQLQPINITVPPVVKTAEPLPEPVSDKDRVSYKKTDKKSLSKKERSSKNSQKRNNQKRQRPTWPYSRHRYLDTAYRGVFSWPN